MIFGAIIVFVVGSICFLLGYNLGLNKGGNQAYKDMRDMVIQYSDLCIQLFNVTNANNKAPVSFQRKFEELVPMDSLEETEPAMTGGEL